MDISFIGKRKTNHLMAFGRPLMGGVIQNRAFEVGFYRPDALPVT